MYTSKCKYFLLFCRLSLHSVDYFLCCTEDFCFDVIPFVYFYFCFLYFGVRSRTSSSRPLSWETSIMFSSNSFIILGLTFKNTILSWILCTMRAKGLATPYLWVDIQFSQHYLLKRLFFLQCRFLAPLLEIS
jgi:hypothetical protein